MTAKHFIILALSALGGCASLPDTAAQTQAVRILAPPQWQSHESVGALSPDWLADLHDASLTALVDEALAHNHDLQASAARIAQARALAITTAAARLPTLDFSAQGVRSVVQNVPDRSSYGATLSVSWEADLWGRIADRAMAGSADARAAGADYAAARLSIAGQTAQAWFDLIEARQQVVLARDDLQSRQRSTRLVERRYRRGVSSSLDVRLARSALADSEANLDLRRQQQANADRRLELLLGRYPANAIAAAEQLPALEPLKGVGRPADVLARRPDIIAAEARLQAAGLRAAQARKALLPRLSFAPSSSTNGGRIADIFDPQRLAANLLGNLAQPVFRGGALRADVRRNHAAQRVQLQSYASLLLRAWRETEDALDGERYLASREAALGVSTTEARAAETLAERQYGRGVGTIFELLDAQRRRINAESQLISAARARVANRVRLHLAIAGNFKGMIAQTPAFSNNPQAVKTAARKDEDGSS